MQQLARATIIILLELDRSTYDYTMKDKCNEVLVLTSAVLTLLFIKASLAQTESTSNSTVTPQDLDQGMRSLHQPVVCDRLPQSEERIYLLIPPHFMAEDQFGYKISISIRFQCEARIDRVHGGVGLRLESVSTNFPQFYDLVDENVTMNECQISENSGKNCTISMFTIDIPTNQQAHLQALYGSEFKVCGKHTNNPRGPTNLCSKTIRIMAMMPPTQTTTMQPTEVKPSTSSTTVPDDETNGDKECVCSNTGPKIQGCNSSAPSVLSSNTVLLTVVATLFSLINC